MRSLALFRIKWTWKARIPVTYNSGTYMRFIFTIRCLAQGLLTSVHISKVNVSMYSNNFARSKIIYELIHLRNQLAAERDYGTIQPLLPAVLLNMLRAL